MATELPLHHPSIALKLYLYKDIESWKTVDLLLGGGTSPTELLRVGLEQPL